MSKLREALDHFGEKERETLRAHGVRYGELLLRLPAEGEPPEAAPHLPPGHQGTPAWGDDLRIVYLAAPSGEEWLSRLLNREPDKLDDARFRETLLGRTASSLSDMELAAEEGVQCVLNHYGKADQAAREILAAWGI